MSPELDEVSDLDASMALAACAAAGRRTFVQALERGIDWSDDALAGALLDRGLEPDEVVGDLLVALAHQFLSTYRAS